jgi:KTSC domain
MPDGRRLNSKNFRRVESDAIRSIDYMEGRAIEIEFINGDVYHYFKAPKRLWTKMQQIIKSGDSLGTYVNQDFKSEVKRLDLDYRKIS